MSMNDVEGLDSVFGSLITDLKNLENWEKLELKKLEEDFRIEKHIEKEKEELFHIESEFRTKRDRIDTNTLGKVGHVQIDGKSKGDEGWKEKMRGRYSGFYHDVVPLKHAIDHKTDEIDALRKKEIYSFKQMTMDIRQVQNQCALLRNHIEHIKQYMNHASFKWIESIINDAEVSSHGMLDKIKFLEQNINKGEKTLNSVKEDAQCLRILLEYKHEAKKEILEIKKELSKIKELKRHRISYTNVFPFKGHSFRLFISSQAKKVLKNNPFFTRRLLMMLPNMIVNGVGLLRSGIIDSDVEAVSNKPWRLMPGSIIRANFDSGARIFYALDRDKVLIGDFTSSSEHDSTYKNISKLIRERKYSLGASKKLDIIPEGANQNMSL